jgi:nitrate reductase gamma subunit
VIYSLFAILALAAVAWFGTAHGSLKALFAVAIPYAAFATFIVGFVWRLLSWARSPVPFHIPTTCGQQQSLPWIKQDKVESPTSTFWVIVRMALEVLLFRSLWKNERVELKRGVQPTLNEKLIYSPKRYLWLGGLIFHWSLAIILFRHLRFFTDPVLPGIAAVSSLDGLFQIGIPSLWLSDAAILIGLTYLLVRRLLIPQMRLISLPSDYFVLFLLVTIVLSGVLMHHFLKTDVERVKELVLGLAAMRPSVPAALGSFFYIHLFLVSILFAYFPFSKLMHAPGVFLSPTRNLKNDSRMKRHINPWNYPVKVHTYGEYEDEFRDAMVEAGIPVEKE